MSSTRQVGILGLGAMGLPIATRLVAGGETVFAYDCSSERRKGLEDTSVQMASSASEVARQSDILLTVLPEGEAVHGAMDAVLELPSGGLWIDLSSSDPRCTEVDHDKARARGIRPVAAPIRGGPHDAIAGTLGFFVSGAADDVEPAIALLRKLSGHEGIRVVGRRGSDAQLVKLLANALWFAQVVASTEALLLGAQHGMDLWTLVDALRESPGGGSYLDRHVDRLLAGDYMEEFALDRCVAELRLVTEMADEAGSPSALLDLVAQAHERALAHLGPVMGELQVAHYLEDVAGLKLRARTPQDGL